METVAVDSASSADCEHFKLLLKITDCASASLFLFPNGAEGTADRF